jgi:hypothetical protein
MPCDHCNRTRQTCIAPTRTATSSFVFVDPGVENQIQLPSRVSLRKSEQDITYFFSSFLPMNTFSNGNLQVQSELKSMVHSSTALRDALCAVACLHRFQRARCIKSGIGDLNGRQSAMQHYVGSVRYVQARIAQNKFIGDPSTLWTTFLLGVFEVCATVRAEVTTV